MQKKIVFWTEFVFIGVFCKHKKYTLVINNIVTKDINKMICYK